MKAILILLPLIFAMSKINGQKFFQVKIGFPPQYNNAYFEIVFDDGNGFRYKEYMVKHGEIIVKEKGYTKFATILLYEMYGKEKKENM